MFVICQAIPFFATFLLFPLLKMSEFALWMPPHPLRPNSYITSKGSHSSCSSAGMSTYSPPSLTSTSEGHLPLCLSLPHGAFDYRAFALPDHWACTRGISGESAPQEMNEYMSHWLCFSPIYIPNTSSVIVLDTSKSKSLYKVKDFHKHMNKQEEGGRQQANNKEKKSQNRQRKPGERLPSCIPL